MTAEIIRPDAKAWLSGPYKPFQYRTKEERDLINALYDRKKEVWVEDWGPGSLNDILLIAFWHTAMVDAHNIMTKIRIGQSHGEPIQISDWGKVA